MRYIFILFVTLFVFSGCTKFAEGPMITLRTNKSRLCKNSWQLSSVRDFEKDKEVEKGELGWSDDFILDFDKELQHYTSSGSSGEISVVFYKGGVWDIINKKELMLAGTTSDGTTGYRKYEILRLTVKALWLKSSTDSEGTFELKFESIDKI